MKCRTCGTTLTAGAVLCGECGTSAITPRPTLGDTARYDRKALLDAIANESRPADAAGSGRAVEPAPKPAERPRPLFSLVFSTGESIRVSGSGLVGRNPAPREGERVDYLVQLIDPARSVSKTHLEFGVDDGSLWIADRGSSNGTRLGLDLLQPIELEPGVRTVVPRGTRVGIGDAFFDVH
ncbi:MAG: FHA domain-containing protein [Herbiconiux sp.]|uniref:FHA domain-containing protein n=1 Tax=Herbiconiux sp. TaxID=1871186 RepID=UPI001208F7EC|nr:FHA domain-containing protein [Herbiconiux sp.]TAJ46748.1 MAG: FHA domain-containing protein [Herbiconiux sp.]